MDNLFRTALTSLVAIMVFVTAFWLVSILYGRWKNGQLLDAPREINIFFRIAFLVLMFLFLVLGAFFQDEMLFLQSNIRDLSSVSVHLSQERTKLNQAQKDQSTLPTVVASLRSRIDRSLSVLTEKEAVANLEEAQLLEEIQQVIAVEQERLQEKLQAAEQTAREEYLIMLDRAQTEAENAEAELKSQLRELELQLETASTEQDRNSIVQRKSVIAEKLEVILDDSFQSKRPNLEQIQARLKQEVNSSHEKNIQKLRSQNIVKLESAKTKFLSAKADHDKLLEELDTAESYQELLPEQIAQLQESIAALQDTTKQLHSDLTSGYSMERAQNWQLVARALCLGALGALVALIVPRRETHIQNLFIGRDYWYLIVSHVIVGAITAVAGFALLYTNFLSIFKIEPGGEFDVVPDYWKITLLCSVLGAYSFPIYGGLRSRIDRMINKAGQEPGESGVGKNET